MLPSNWIEVSAIESFPLREGRNVRVNGLDIAVFNLGERCLAVENRCPHLDGPLVDGIVSSVDGKLTVTCPLHARRVCLESGATVKPSGEGHACIRTFEVRVENGMLALALDGIAAREVA